MCETLESISSTAKGGSKGGREKAEEDEMRFILTK
jgi:hypothetical protein